MEIDGDAVMPQAECDTPGLRSGVHDHGALSEMSAVSCEERVPVHGLTFLMLPLAICN